MDVIQIFHVVRICSTSFTKSISDQQVRLCDDFQYSELLFSANLNGLASFCVWNQQRRREKAHFSLLLNDSLLSSCVASALPGKQIKSVVLSPRTPIDPQNKAESAHLSTKVFIGGLPDGLTRGMSTLALLQTCSIITHTSLTLHCTFLSERTKHKCF